MSADDNLSEPQFYHGTSAKLRDGDLIDASYSDRGPHVFFTSKRSFAATYGGRAYKVTPTGPYEHDPNTSEGFPSFRSKSPLRVHVNHRNTGGG